MLSRSISCCASPEAFYKLNVAEQFRCGPGKPGGFGHDRFLDGLNFFSENGAEDPEDRNGGEIDGGNKPVNAECIDRDKDDSYQGCEKNIDGRRNEPFDITSHFCSFSASRRYAGLQKPDTEVERLLQTVRINPCTESLSDDIDVVVLEILRNPRNECNPDRECQQQTDPFEELLRRVFLEPGRVFVDHMPEDQRVKKRKSLIDRSKEQSKCDQLPAMFRSQRRSFMIQYDSFGLLARQRYGNWE